MIGLIMKDGYTMVKQTKFFLLMTVIFAVIPSEFLFAYSIFYASMLSITALAYDEHAKWDKLARMMPYSTGQIVGSKYLIGYMAVGAVMILTILSRLILGAITGQGVKPEMFAALLLVSCIALIVQAINFPIMFKVGVQKGRMVFIFFAVVVMVLITSFFEDFGMLMIQVNWKLLMMGMPVIVVVLNLISFRLSKMIYDRNKN